MSLSTFNAEEAENLDDIEKQFAVKAVTQAETYWNLLTKIPGTKLKLTPYDDEIFEALLKDFPEFENPEYASKINEDEMKSLSGKDRWRKFMKPFEEKIDDFNFGTLLRTDSSKEYDQEGTIFVVRLQFYAIEIARNKYGLNDWISQK
ncbi:hypothetical protein LJB42_001420 [Komagataella kurtzmanii]|nr:hypothetical protein LJB42_001420 [Komagataella kurtzmanii]